jgi:zinc transport system ATP-binding protein
METAIHIEDLSVYYGKTSALSGVFLDVKKGEFLGVIGPNGGGKSTLLKAILGLLPASTGNIKIHGQAPGKNKTSVGYVPQFASIDKQFPISAIEVVLTARLKKGLSFFHAYTKEDKALAYEQLKRVGIEHLAKRQISELSGGEFQRLLIARALTVQPKLLLLDEPTASVDASSREQIFKILKELNNEMTIVLVTHDLHAISSEVQKLACLNRQLVYHGEPKLTNEIMKELYGFLPQQEHDQYREEKTS